MCNGNILAETQGIAERGPRSCLSKGLSIIGKGGGGVATDMGYDVSAISNKRGNKPDHDVYVDCRLPADPAHRMTWQSINTLNILRVSTETNTKKTCMSDRTLKGNQHAAYWSYRSKQFKLN